MSTFYKCDRCNKDFSGQPFATIEPMKYYPTSKVGEPLVLVFIRDLCEPCWDVVTNLIDEYRGNDG